ncbi:hypothetical protein PV326_009748 [Microctonus aethiopoides]|uniref:Chromosome transmission fidelity protein 8 n=1 Tax=Microctonus aethiopoides TaxID=144406 RepID=A0AA39C676_9HYME|nr:hypothetical protein PV326_009748 [Microctonus aethiopoides]KAK0158225.1 hypothetical protein PV328_009257 [Microctonus aethiopoides]
MIIPIVSESGKLPEWAIVELQGSLETYHPVVDPKAERFIGDLHYKQGDDNSAILIIGSHVLNGKEVTLSKPLGVLVKETGEPVPEDKKGEETNTRWIVKGVVRKKLIFKSRPKPIVTDLPKST